MKTDLLPSALYWAQFNRFELRLPGAAVNDIARPGSNDEAVALWASKVRNEWPERATPDAIRAELKEYGTWDETDLADDAANWERLLWCAAHNIAESDAPDCSPSVDEAKRLRAGEAGGFRVTQGYAKSRDHHWTLHLRGEYLTTFPTRREAREAMKQTRLYVLRDAGSLTPIHDVARRYLATLPR